MIAVDQAVQFPGNCAFCQRSQGPFVDTLRDDDDPRVEVKPDQMGYGQINRWYICAGCVSTMMQLVAPKLGLTFLQTATLVAERAEASAVAAAFEAAKVRVDDLESTLRVMQSLMPEQAKEPTDASVRTRRR